VVNDQSPSRPTAIGGAGTETIQPELSLAREGVITYIWKMGYGDILIEVYTDGHVAVNGDQVQTKSSVKT
jgi:hypothetical protein